MPITIPKIVSPERTLLAESAVYVSSIVSFNFILLCSVGCDVVLCSALLVILLVRKNEAVADHNDALCVFRDVWFMRNQNDRSAMIFVQCLKCSKHNFAGASI